jgi:NUMOD3 motif
MNRLFYIAQFNQLNSQNTHNNPEWKYDDIGYGSHHKWIRKYLARSEVCGMWMQEPIYDLACITNVYNSELTNWQYLFHNLFHRSHIKIDIRAAALPLVRPKSSRKQSEETKLKISKANKGKRSGCDPWNKGKKVHYIHGKREHSEHTKQKMSEAAKRRWASMHNYR